MRRSLSFGREMGLDVLSIALAAIFLFPVIWVFIASIRPEQDILSGGLLITRATVDHYVRLFGRGAFRAAIGNSVLVAISTAFLSSANVG